MNNILLWDKDKIENRPLSRFKSIFSFRNGIFTFSERYKILYPNATFFSGIQIMNMRN